MVVPSREVTVSIGLLVRGSWKAGFQHFNIQSDRADARCLTTVQTARLGLPVKAVSKSRSPASDA
jgi:Ca2+/H+ antiporter